MNQKNKAEREMALREKEGCKEKMDQRMCLSEHPFGTIKRAMGSTYFFKRDAKSGWGVCTLLSGI